MSCAGRTAVAEPVASRRRSASRPGLPNPLAARRRRRPLGLHAALRPALCTALARRGRGWGCRGGWPAGRCRRGGLRAPRALRARGGRRGLAPALRREDRQPCRTCSSLHARPRPRTSCTSSGSRSSRSTSTSCRARGRRAHRARRAAARATGGPLAAQRRCYEHADAGRALGRAHPARGGAGVDPAKVHAIARGAFEHLTRWRGHGHCRPSSPR